MTVIVFGVAAAGYFGVMVAWQCGVAGDISTAAINVQWCVAGGGGYFGGGKYFGRKIMIFCVVCCEVFKYCRDMVSGREEKYNNVG